MVSHICLLVELDPICNSMAASLCLKSCEDHSLLKSYNVGLWKKHLQVWSLKYLCNNYFQLKVPFGVTFLQNIFLRRTIL